MSGARWSRYRIRLAASAKPEGALRPVIADLLEELQARPHLAAPLVEWNENDSRAVVEVGTEDYDPKVAAESVREELVEVIPTLVRDFDEVTVDVIEIIAQSP